MLAHISWKDDHLCVTSPKSKSDQAGEATYPRAVYANPLQPMICPVLALSICVFTTPIVPTPHPSLFCGSNQEGRYGKILQSVISTLPDSEAASLGCKKEEIGTHSGRKGPSTFALSLPGGPSPVTTYLRAGWSLGNVQDRYIFAGEGGDQLCGRTLAGLPLSDSTFATLPPHFSKETLLTLTDNDWRIILPGLSGYPESFRQVEHSLYFCV